SRERDRPGGGGDLRHLLALLAALGPADRRHRRQDVEERRRLRDASGGAGGGPRPAGGPALPAGELALPVAADTLRRSPARGRRAAPAAAGIHSPGAGSGGGSPGGRR